MRKFDVMITDEYFTIHLILMMCACGFPHAYQPDNILMNFVYYFDTLDGKAKIKIALNTKAFRHCAIYSFVFACNKKVLCC